jgi:hypothetical protein
MTTRTAPLYVPGRRIICTADEIALEFHSKGWHPPENDRIWIDGVEGELSFTVRRPATAYVFSAEVSPFVAPPHTLEIFFNYSEWITSRSQFEASSTSNFPRSCSSCVRVYFG